MLRNGVMIMTSYDLIPLYDPYLGLFLSLVFPMTFFRLCSFMTISHALLDTFPFSAARVITFLHLSLSC